MKVKTTIWAVIGITFLISCQAQKNMSESNTSETSQTVLLNDIWVVEKIQGAAVTATDFGREMPSLEFHMVDGKVMGHSGCNRISGTYRTNGDKIIFGPMISTKMACPGNGEQRFMDALNKAKTFRIENLKLRLIDENNEVLVFKKVD